MALFSYEALKSKYDLNEQAYDRLFENAKHESVDMRDEHTEFDIFLSHSYKDKEIIPYLKKELESMGYSVYVDWLNDKFLSRDEVTSDTAKVLQTRMKQSKSLFFATSENSSNSKWMPWELGYFDGIKDKKVAILPINTNNNFVDDTFEGQEYLGLYYYVSFNKASKHFENEPMAMEKNSFRQLLERLEKIKMLFIHKSKKEFVTYNDWMDGEDPMSLDSKLSHIVKEFNKVKD